MRLLARARSTAPRSRSASGSAYTFTRSGSVWSQSGKLLASDGAASDQFGIAVAVSGGTAAAGADGHDEKGSGAGAAYVYVSFSTGGACTAPVDCASGSRKCRV